MSATAAKEYGSLLARTLPKPIHSEAENELAIQQLEKLAGKTRPSAAERQLMELLTVLIEAFEEEYYPIGKQSSPVEVLQELMASNDLKRKDLADIFGTPSIISEVMHGKRSLTIGHIRKLSERFHVSPDLFFSFSPSL
jgi:HTH-type transcriptional regulator/antitoxin HigA